MLPKSLIEKRHTLNAAREQLRRTLEAVQNVNVDTQQRFDQLMKGDLKYSDALHQQRARDMIRKDFLQARRSALGIAQHAVSEARQALHEDVAQFEATAQRAPDVESAWLARTRQAGVTAELSVQIQIADELRQARLERAPWKPGRWHQAYVEAQADPTLAEHASVIRYVENRVADDPAWPTASSPQDAELAHSLRVRVGEVQKSRLPIELGEVHQDLAGCSRLLERARIHVDAINPANDPRAAALAGVE